MHWNGVLKTGLLAAAVWTGLSLAAVPVWAQDGTAQAGYRVPHYTSGVQAYRQGDYERAINYFRRVLAHDPANTNAYYYLAISLDRLNLVSDAIPAYQYVAAHGQETRIVEYAKARLQALLPTPVPAARHFKDMALQPEVALVAAGSQTVPAVYRGSVSQVAVPLKNNRNALMVDAAISNGKARATGTFIIDTGATYTSISQDMAEKLGLDLTNCEKVRITTANGRIEVPKVVIETLNVNGLEAHNVEATVIQVRHGSSFSGLLGLSFIRQFVLTIDPAANQLIFQRN